MDNSEQFEPADSGKGKDLGEMAAFGASHNAGYLFPDRQDLRAAYCQGAADTAKANYLATTPPVSGDAVRQALGKSHCITIMGEDRVQLDFPTMGDRDAFVAAYVALTNPTGQATSDPQ